MLNKNKGRGKDMARSSGILRKGQTTAPRQIADTKKSGGEHDLSKVRVDERIIDRIKSNIGQGWKTEYKSEYANIVVEMLSKEDQCFTLRLLCAVIGCSERTMYTWIEKHDDFAQAVAYGKSLQEVHFGNILLQGFKYSRSVEYVLANLHDWTQKKEERHSVVDLNKEIAEREAFAANHRARKKIDWKDGTFIDAEILVEPNTDKNTDTTYGESIGKEITRKPNKTNTDNSVPQHQDNNKNII